MEEFSLRVPLDEPTNPRLNLPEFLFLSMDVAKLILKDFFQLMQKGTNKVVNGFLNPLKPVQDMHFFVKDVLKDTLVPRFSRVLKLNGGRNEVPTVEKRGLDEIREILIVASYDLHSKRLV